MSNINKLNPFNEVVRGIEKEALRVDTSGRLSSLPHPNIFGKALTHPNITTDFSEALLEFVTPISRCSHTTLNQLKEIQGHVITNLKNELIWPASMPTSIESEEEIPVALYGKSNQGKLKTVYREGLAHRYGKSMQAIAGIHYNFSVSDELMSALYKKEDSSLSLKDFQTEKYFGLIRNFLRYEWLLIYLFGACPVVDKSFLEGKKHKLKKLHKNTYHLPFATSLRMSNLGYTSSAQESLHICYNSLDNYLATLAKALSFPYPDYENIGSDNPEEPKQINSHLLQIENEFYSTIRPKRVTQQDERPLNALRLKGVEYIEVRLLDINPELTVGIDQTQMDFLDSFLLYCLLSDSPKMTNLECIHVKDNRKIVVEQGLKPNLKIAKGNAQIPLADFGLNVLNQILIFTKEYHASEQINSIMAQIEKMSDPSLTPAAKILKKLKESDMDYVEYILAQAQNLESRSREDLQAISAIFDFNSIAEDSKIKQIKIEKADTMNFLDYLKKYNLETPKV